MKPLPGLAWASVALLLALQSAACPAPGPGDSIPPFTLPALDGEGVRWQPGTVTVFSFCAFWCDTWQEQTRRLLACEKSLSGLPVRFLTVSVDGRWSERGRNSAGPPVLLDTGSRVSSRLGIQTVPYTVVVAGEGWVHYAAQGILRADAVQRAVRELFDDRGAPLGGIVYLTFDDFPSPQGDDELLDLLRAEGVQATFFCIGQNIARRKEMVRRAAREGHSLQIHSWSHDALRPEAARCAQALREAASIEPTLYRPPGRPVLRRLDGGTLALPVVNPYDFSRPGESELVRRMLLAAKPGSVILLHAGVAETRAALPRVLAALRQRGFSFGVLR
jgi:hypothetical protein